MIRIVIKLLRKISIRMTADSKLYINNVYCTVKYRKSWRLLMKKKIIERYLD